MTASNIDLHGSIVALVTPMHADATIDYSALERLIDFHLQHQTAGIVSVGTSGESATLDTKEHCAVIAETVRLIDGRIPVIGGTGANSTQEAINLTQEAERLGIDACLLVTPYYNKPTQEGLYRHFKAIAEAVNLPCILYNVPARTAVDLSNDTVLRLAEIDNIIALKDATGDPSRGEMLLQHCSESFTVLSGDDISTLESLKRGARGAISVTANVAPRRMQAMCQLALAKDFTAAEAINKELIPLHRELFCESNPIPVKWALAEMGLIEHGIRLPLTSLDARHHQSLRPLLSQADTLS